MQRGRACVRCEATLPADAHFCPACGTRADAG
ncbi:zinc-ribbon domain-containing protein [Burkholderia multivorans]